MKKFFCFLVIVLTCTSVFALDFSWGCKLDLGLNKFTQEIEINELNYSATEKVDTSFVFSLRLGAVFSFQFSEYFAIEPEFMLNLMNGAKVPVSVEEGYSGESRVRYISVELPLMLKGQIPVGSGKLSLGIGPQVNCIITPVEQEITIKKIATGAKTELKGSNSVEDYGFNRFTFGIAAGLEYIHNIGEGDLIFGLRFACDLTNLINVDTVRKQFQENGISANNYSFTGHHYQIFPSIAFIQKI